MHALAIPIYIYLNRVQTCVLYARTSLVYISQRAFHGIIVGRARNVTVASPNRRLRQVSTARSFCLDTDIAVDMSRRRFANGRLVWSDPFSPNGNRCKRREGKTRSGFARRDGTGRETRNRGNRTGWVVQQ